MKLHPLTCEIWNEFFTKNQNHSVESMDKIVKNHESRNWITIDGNTVFDPFIETCHFETEDDCFIGYRQGNLFFADGNEIPNVIAYLVIEQKRRHKQP